MSTRARFREQRNRLREPGLSVLLTVQGLAMFLVGPLMATGFLGPWSFDICLIMMALVSMYIARNRRARFLILLGVGGIVVSTAFRAILTQDNLLSSFGTTVSFMLFITTVSIVVARIVFGAGPVTLHRLQGAIVIYLNIALAFGLVGNVIVMLSPDAYSNVSATTKNHLGDMIYFSMTTLTTTGYGDFVPIHPMARSLANLEALIGQIYPATLIAALVGMHVSYKRPDSG